MRIWIWSTEEQTQAEQYRREVEEYIVSEAEPENQEALKRMLKSVPIQYFSPQTDLSSNTQTEGSNNGIRHNPQLFQPDVSNGEQSNGQS